MERWTDKFRDAALARIQEYEKFLDKCGIMPVAGMEQEFYVAIPNGKQGFTRMSFDAEAVSNYDFQGSQFVERVYRDRSDEHLYEIAVGRGNERGLHTMPDRELMPSETVRHTMLARQAVEGGIKVYTADKNATVDYDGSKTGGTKSSLQANISLWDVSNGQPLFRNNPPESSRALVANALTMQCLKALLEAQEEMIALTVTSDASMKRLKNRDTGTPKRFDAGNDKNETRSLLLRTKQKNEPVRQGMRPDSSVYIENRLAGGGEDPALTMLVTLGGIVQGVQQYMRDHNLRSPEAMEQHIASGVLSKPLAVNFDSMPTRPVPASLERVLAKTEQSPLAMNIMGDELHAAFCDAYKKEVLNKIGRKLGGN